MYLVSKTETFAKLFFVISFSGLLAYISLAFFSYHIAYTNLTSTKKLQDKFQKYPDSDVTQLRFDKDFKFILLWTTYFDNFFKNKFGEGQNVFINSNCRHVNCYITTNKNLLDNDYKHFDAVVLSQATVKRWMNLTLPQERSAKQKYIFYSDQPASENVVCNKHSEKYFNWTWTYKLYSNIFKPFIEVKDFKGNVIAPSFRPDWTSIVKGQNDTADFNMSGKTKALAWVMNVCGTIQDRFNYVRQLDKAMTQQNLVLDIYGCHQKSCPGKDCAKTIRDYYFYLAYEVAKIEDYISEEVLKAYDNNAVPIVIGGADYTKFLPPGSYIDASQNSIENIVGLMEYFIRNPELYNRFHRWRKFYTITRVEPTRGVCELCTNLNDITRMEQRSSYEFFRKWWYSGPLYEVCLPKSAEKIEEVLSYINGSKYS